MTTAPTTYETITTRNHRAIRCLLCGALSFNESDIVQRYCGRCHLFHDSIRLARLLNVDGATHECNEWRTGRGTCAICGALVRPEATT